MATWTEAEFEYLHDNLGIKYFDEIAEHLKKTPRSVREKARRNGLSLYDNIYTYLSLSKELGVSTSTLRKWVRLGYIHGRRATWRCKHGRTHEHPMIFVENDVLNFLKKYSNIISPVLDDTLIPNRYFRNFLHHHSIVPYVRTGALHKDSRLRLADIPSISL